MQDTIRRIIKVLGGSGAEALGQVHRFFVEGPDGARMKVMVEASQQRLIAELSDSRAAPRAAVDVGPIAKVTEDSGRPGRVTLHVGSLSIHLDSQPLLAISITSGP